MSQNRSSAVMQQRAEPHDSLDDFPTPPWAGRALVEHVLSPLAGYTRDETLWEPAANRGFLWRGLHPYFSHCWTTDVFDYGLGPATVLDFLFPGTPTRSDWIITNPPFRLAREFIETAIQRSNIGCAMLVRTSFLEGVGRYESLFRPNPPTFVAQFAERVPMVKGRCDPDASTATSYCWIGWIKGRERQPTMWIPPCRKQLERAGDYEDASA